MATERSGSEKFVDARDYRGHLKPKPRLRWKLPREWHRSELAQGELGNWETPNGENTVVIKKKERLFVVEASDYMGEYTQRIAYTSAQGAFDGAYDEMWGRTPDCRSG